jgi:PAS domain S-box-containing protein
VADPRRGDRDAPSDAIVDALERGARIGRFRWCPEGGDVWWSDELYRIFGLPTDTELTFDAVRAVIPDTDVDWVQSQARGSGTVSSPLVFWQNVRRPDGEDRTVEVRAWPEGEELIVGTAQDITESVRTRDERDRLHRQRELVLNATAEGICGLDREGRITFLNGAAAAILGRDDEVLLGAAFHDLVHRVRDRESHTNAACPFVVAAGEGTPRHNRNDFFRRPDGTAFEAEYSLLPVNDPDLDGCVVTFRDVTDRIITERRLRRTLTEVQALSAQRARLLGEVTLAQEQEWARIAGDIHDDTVQVMNAVALRLERAEGLVATPERFAEHLGELRTLVRDATDRLRRLLFDLYPPDIGAGLPEAIGRYGGALGAEAGFTVAVEMEGTETLTDDERTLVYRLAQEALSNVTKHARAENVHVVVRSGPSGTQLVVEDDGAGFDPRGLASRRPGHLGLTVLRQRTESAGGQVRIRSTPGRGTQIEAWLPPAAGGSDG